MRNWFRGLKLNEKFTVTTLIFIYPMIYGILFDTPKPKAHHAKKRMPAQWL